MKSSHHVVMPLNPKGQSRGGGYGGALPGLLLAGAFGVLSIIGYALQAQKVQDFFAVAGGGLLMGGAALLVGGLIGFLFGMPRSRGEERPTPERENITTRNDPQHSRYRPNTNLEDISDWLTKILVGVGLTQLTGIPAGMHEMGRILAPVLGSTAGSEVFVVGIVVFFAVCGFFLGFLWSRLTLPGLYTEADLIAVKESATEEGERIGAEKFMASAQRAAESVVESKVRRVLWVDDRPDNNAREREVMERLLNLKFTNVRSTSEALTEIKREGEKFSLIISDMGRPGDPRAGYTLLDELRKAGVDEPYIIYAGSGAFEHDAEARRRGAEGCTNNPQRLLDLVRTAIERNNLVA